MVLIAEKLNNIYSILPETKCMKSSCAQSCCSKLKESLDNEGNFMPLPLIYSVEYLHILNFLCKKYSSTQLERIYDFSKKNLICPFFNGESLSCGIYSVRPFSCRVFGRKVPPFFWGMEVTEEQSKYVYCKDLETMQHEKEPFFHQQYPLLWEKLLNLSISHSPFTSWQKYYIQKITGMQDLLILAFGEFYLLTHSSRDWFENSFEKYWTAVKNLL